MTEEQTRIAARNVIYLVECAVNEKIPDLKGIEDIKAVYSYAARHKLTAAVALALESAGQKDRESTLAITNALKRMIVFEKAYAQVKEELEKAGIWYLPLKGMVLKDYYPKPLMREMGDHDILFDADRAKDVKAIMEELGYETDSFDSSNHDCYNKMPFLRFEMHRELFNTSYAENQYEYYRDVEKKLLGDGYEKHLSPEDFYLYLIAHEYKHYALSGTGLRSLLDTYVILKKETLDFAYVEAEAEKMGIGTFESENRTLALRLFSGEDLTAKDQEMLDYFLSSGVYGTRENNVQNRLSKNRYGKIRYAFERFIEPINKKSWNYPVLSKEFPFFYRHKILLPILMVYRVILRLKGNRLKSEIKALRRAKV